MPLALAAVAQPYTEHVAPPLCLGQKVYGCSPPDTARFVQVGDWHRYPPPWALQHRPEPLCLHLEQCGTAHIWLGIGDITTGAGCVG